MAFDTGLLTFDSYNGADADLFLYTDPQVTDATLPQNATGNRRWQWRNTTPPSSGIGPENDITTGYLVNETSDTGTGFDEEYYLEYDTTVDASTQDITFEFETNQRGTDNGTTCVVETNENGAGWVERGTVFGGISDPDRVDSSGTDYFVARSVDLSGLISHASTRLRIKLTLPSSGTTWHNDYGLDHIQIFGVDSLVQDQDGFQFLDDDAAVGSETTLAAEDTNISRNRQAPFRIRVQVDNTGNPPAEAMTLQYKEVSDAAAEWRDVPL